MNVVPYSGADCGDLLIVASCGSVIVWLSPPEPLRPTFIAWSPARVALSGCGSSMFVRPEGFDAGDATSKVSLINLRKTDIP